MAENIPPLSVKLLAKELGEVDDWYQLGTVLGVSPKRLDEIRKSSPVGGTGEWRIAMLQAWMDSKDDASWIDVIEAVKSLRHIVLAAILKSKYVPKTTEPSHDAVPTKVSEVRASVAVVDCVLHVQKCFSRMLTNMRQLSTKVDIKNVRFFLESILEADEFNTCKGFEDVLRLLRKSYIDAFNTSYLEQLAEYLEIDEINQLISAYKRERDAFFNDPIVTEFQDAVFNKVEFSDEDGIKVPEVRVPRSLVNKRTQRDMETLTTQFCGSYREPVVQTNDVPESKNVTSNWPVRIAVLLAIATVLLVVLAIGIKLNSSFEINSLNAQVVELRAQLTHCQNEKRQMKKCEEEVKNLTEVKGRFLAMKEESNNSLAKYADDMHMLDWLKNYNAKITDKLDNCDSRLRKYDTELNKLMSNLTIMHIEHEECSLKLKDCREHLLQSHESKEELRTNVNMLTSKNHELTKKYTQCSKRLTTCQDVLMSKVKSAGDIVDYAVRIDDPLYSLLHSRKCFKIMWGHFELNCHSIFVM